MRTSLRCRSCDSRKLWRVDPVMLPQFHTRNALYRLPVVCRSEFGSTDPHGWGERQEHGRFEVWICAGCGLTEWYAVDVNESLSRLSREPSSGVSYVDGDAQKRDDRG